MTDTARRAIVAAIFGDSEYEPDNALFDNVIETIDLIIEDAVVAALAEQRAFDEEPQFFLGPKWVPRQDQHAIHRLADDGNPLCD